MVHGFDSQEKTKLDVLTSKNAKFFFHRMNEVWQANNLTLKKVKYNVVTEDYIAIEKNSKSKLAIFCWICFGNL